MRKYFAVMAVAGLVLVAPATAYAATPTDPTQTPSTSSPGPQSPPEETPTPEPTGDNATTPSAEPPATPPASPTTQPTSPTDGADDSVEPSPSQSEKPDGGTNGMAVPPGDEDKKQTEEDAAAPQLRVYDRVVVPGEAVHVEGVGCKLGTTAAVRGDGAVLASFEVTKEERGGTLFKGDVTIPDGWANGSHEITATCGDVTLGPVTITVDKTTVEAFAQVSDTTVYPGQRISFSGRCELNAPTVSIIDIVAGKVLAEVDCGEDGRFSGKLTIPESWVPGVEGSLGFTCLTKDGMTSGHRVDFTVIKKPGSGDDKDDTDKGDKQDRDDGELQGSQLPFTGAAGLPLLLGLGGALVVAGGLLMVVVRRRTRSASQDGPTT